MGYDLAGFDVVGFDLEPQPLYPFDFVRADGLEVDLSGFDAVHASPHCQRFTAYRRKGHGVGEDYPDQIAAFRARLRASGLPYVIENVPGAPLLSPVVLCGSMFGLEVRRHRLFESNVALAAPPCDHASQRGDFPQATNRRNRRRTCEIGVWRIPLDVQKRAMGIDWMDLDGLSNAIPPAYTRHLGAQLLGAAS